ncbi:MAG TPA: deaminase [Candidatus Limnocylindrales bacterium]|nr:deaminase [Candidatus Limnocylindrales bacterium]
MTTDEIHMARALEIAAAGMRAGEMPIGAVVAVDGDVIAEAHTQERTQNRLLVHADLLALDAADSKLAGRRRRATLYVTLEPCIMCVGAAFTMRVGALVYALESPSDGGCQTLLDWDKARNAESMPGYTVPAIRSGLMRLESALLFRQYAGTAQAGWTKTWAEELAALGGA